MGLQVENRAIYALLRSIERQLGEPLHEVEALAASLYQYSHDIAHEIHQRYNGEIADRLVAMAPVVILFFVLHAIAAQLVKTGHPAAVAFMALLEASGWIFGIDFALINLEPLAEAGRHFQRMELLHRTAQGEKAELTKLSEGHLDARRARLARRDGGLHRDGRADRGSYSISRFGPALAEGVKKALAAKGQARVKLNLEDGVVTSIQQLPRAVETNVKLAVKKAQPTGQLKSTQRPVGGERANLVIDRIRRRPRRRAGARCSKATRRVTVHDVDSAIATKHRKRCRRARPSARAARHAARRHWGRGPAKTALLAGRGDGTSPRERLPRRNDGAGPGG